MNADDVWGPIAPWIGLLDLVGVGIAFVVWMLVRGGTDRTRAIASVVGATFVASALFAALAGVNRIASLLTMFGSEREDSGRTVADVVLILAGLAIGIYAVFEGHRRLVPGSAAATADDAYADEDHEGYGGVREVIGDTEEIDDEEPIDDEDIVPRRGVLPGPLWVDAAALAVAVALPTVAGSIAFYGGAPEVDRDVTVLAALYHLLAGLLAALPLLVLVARDDTHDPRLLGAAFGLIGIGVLILPIWAEVFANEFWTAFAAGLGTGLLAAVTFSLLSRAVSFDRLAATAGVVVALALIVLSQVLSVRVVRDHQQGFLDEFGGDVENGPLPVFPSGPDVIFPTELPTDFDP